MTVQPERQDLEESKGNFNDQILNFEAQLSEKNEYIIKLEKQLLRYQALVPLSLSNKDDDVFTHNEVTTEYITFILNNPLLQAYEQHLE